VTGRNNQPLVLLHISLFLSLIAYSRMDLPSCQHTCDVSESPALVKLFYRNILEGHLNARSLHRLELPIRQKHVYWLRKEGTHVNRKRFEGKVALVTGAGSPRGIGRATALALVREGAKVTITDIVADNVKRVVSELTEISQVIGEVADVRSKDQMVQVVKRTTEAFGGLDILVNVAGLTRPTLFLDISEEEYDLVLDVNLKGTFLTTQAAVPALLERGGGTIVSLASVSGQRGGGVFGTSAYSAAKAGIMGLTKALARELTPRGIRVNCVAPSMVDTDIAGDLLTPERKVELAKGTLVGRLATVEDVANCILFLASDESAYLTGVTLDINGGMHMH
jgi:NAD(P)-dependent dehydrogenase (short-subunit alcohol dehydrogenase family)